MISTSWLATHSKSRNITIFDVGICRHVFLRLNPLTAVVTIQKCFIQGKLWRSKGSDEKSRYHLPRGTGRDASASAAKRPGVGTDDEGHLGNQLFFLFKKCRFKKHNSSNISKVCFTFLNNVFLLSAETLKSKVTTVIWSFQECASDLKGMATRVATKWLKTDTFGWPKNGTVLQAVRLLFVQ